MSDFPPGSVWPAEDHKSQSIREVYAHYGLAMYQAQVLEHGIANAVLILSILPTRAQHGNRTSWEATVDHFYEREFDKTLGNMIKSLEAQATIPRSLIDRLRTAKRARDFLAHSFFRHYAQAFMTDEGRRAMITHCEQNQLEFETVDRDLGKLVRPYRESFGITEELVQKESERMLKDTGLDY